MKKLAMVFGGLVLSLPLAGYAQSDVIASVGKASVTQADIEALIKPLSPDNRLRLAAEPATLDQMVRAQLADKSVLAEAKVKGWDRQPQVQAAIENAQREIIVRSYLASVSAPPADYPSDADIQSAYNQNHAAFTAPRMLRISQLLVATASNADAASIDKARRRATDLARQAQASGGDFATLAKANSQDKTSAANGGDMGFTPETSLVPEIRQVVGKLKVGDVAGPVQTAAGFHVIKLVDTRPPGLRPLADVKEQIRAVLRQQRMQQNAQAYLAKLAGPTTVTINESALKKALAAAQ
ncbi:peptidylprolyl isomerase [Paraburkholderia sp. WC7.3d]|uniref:peptidylprolyl isomerase n=1 Tax=Paraburkholderia sp. WC7.3d TaxID=2991069 RepID=UPI003D1CA259